MSTHAHLILGSPAVPRLSDSGRHQIQDARDFMGEDEPYDINREFPVGGVTPYRLRDDAGVHGNRLDMIEAFLEVLAPLAVNPNSSGRRSGSTQDNPR